MPWDGLSPCWMCPLLGLTPAGNVPLPCQACVPEVDVGRTISRYSFLSQDHFQVFIYFCLSSQLTHLGVTDVGAATHDFSKSLTTKPLFLQAPALVIGMIFSVGEFLPAVLVYAHITTEA